jgi:hypothetical protein
MARRTKNAGFSRRRRAQVSENHLKIEVENVYNIASGCKRGS